MFSKYAKFLIPMFVWVTFIAPGSSYVAKAQATPEPIVTPIVVSVATEVPPIVINVPASATEQPSNLNTYLFVLLIVVIGVGGILGRTALIKAAEGLPPTAFHLLQVGSTALDNEVDSFVHGTPSTLDDLGWDEVKRERDALMADIIKAREALKVITPNERAVSVSVPPGSSTVVTTLTPEDSSPANPGLPRS